MSSSTNSAPREKAWKPFSMGCHILGYNMGLVPDRLLAPQQLEASRRGWRAPKHPDLTKCRYHRADGCALVLFKSPACIGYLCEGIEADLSKRFERTALERFYRTNAYKRCEKDGIRRNCEHESTVL